MVEIDNRVTNATGRMPSITFYLNEGNFTRNENMDTDEGWKRGGAFASQAQKGMDMQISTSADRTVEPFSSGILIGRLRTRPHGTLPKVTVAAGAYTPRKGTLDLYGEIDWIQIDDTHAAITPGTYLEADGSNPGRYKIKATATNVIALESRAINETGYLLVYKKPGLPQ